MAEPDADQLRRMEGTARDIGGILRGAMPPGVGFFLCLYDFGDSGWMTYLGNGVRADVIKLLHELAAKLEANAPTPRESGYSKGSESPPPSDGKPPTE